MRIGDAVAEEAQAALRSADVASITRTAVSKADGQSAHSVLRSGYPTSKSLNAASFCRPCENTEPTRQRAVLFAERGGPLDLSFLRGSTPVECLLAGRRCGCLDSHPARRG